MVLVCGAADEAPVERLLESLRDLGIDHLMLDQRTMVEDARLRWQLRDGVVSGQLRVGAKVVETSDIQSVYHRLVNPEDVLGPDASQQDIDRGRSLLRSLMDLLDILPARVVNRRRPMMSNNSKPYQALLARQAGFAVPETLVTNIPDEVREFAASGGPVVFKSTSSVRSIVQTLDAGSASRVDTVRSLPTQFQRCVDGLNVRVHVVGQRAFATRILTSATDYRYAAREDTTPRFEPYELTDALRKQCLRLARECGLSFAGIDLIVAPAGAVCLEVNPSPGYSYYQDATGQPISTALAEFLARAKPGKPGPVVCPRPNPLQPFGS